MADKRYIGSVSIIFHTSGSQGDHDDDNVNNHTIVDLGAIQRSICSMSSVTHLLTKPEDMNSGTTDIPPHINISKL